jgi:hypothetical protein
MHCAVFAATDLVLNTSKERFYYPKGAMVQLEVGQDQDVYVVHHRMSEAEGSEGDACELFGKKGTLQKNDDGKIVCKVGSEESADYKKESKVVSTNLRFVRIEDLHFMLDSVIFESQLSPTIDFKDSKINEVLLDERLSPAMVSRYLTDATTPLEKSYFKDKVQHVRLPIRTKRESLTSKEKVKILQNFDAMESTDIQSEDILSIDARTAGNANETGYLISVEALLGNTNADMLGYLESKMIEGLPEGWKLRRTQEGKIKVETQGARPAPLATFLSTLPLKTETRVLNTDGIMNYEVSIATPNLKPVVETYYTKNTAYEKFTRIEADGKPEEGDTCKTDDGKTGVLTKQGDALVCMVKESYTPDFREAAAEGDPCKADGKDGVMKMVNGALACVVKETRTLEGNPMEVPDDAKEGDDCEAFGKKGKVTKSAKGNLYCKVTETVETIAFTAPMVKLEAEFGGDGEGANAASPAPGDSCDAQGKPGTLKLINGALVCSAGELPAGADGAS